MSTERFKSFFKGMALGAVMFAGLYTFKYVFTSAAKTQSQTACASILNVVNPEGSTFERNSATQDDNGRVVRMLYSVTDPAGAGKRVVIVCAFDGTAQDRGEQQLVAVSINGRQLGPARIAFLNRFWLRSDRAQAALPAASSPSGDKSATGFIQAGNHN